MKRLLICFMLLTIVLVGCGRSRDDLVLDENHKVSNEDDKSDDEEEVEEDNDESEWYKYSNISDEYKDKAEYCKKYTIPNIVESENEGKFEIEASKESIYPDSFIPYDYSKDTDESLRDFKQYIYNYMRETYPDYDFNFAYTDDFDAITINTCWDENENNVVDYIEAYLVDNKRPWDFTTPVRLFFKDGKPCDVVEGPCTFEMQINFEKQLYDYLMKNTENNDNLDRVYLSIDWNPMYNDYPDLYDMTVNNDVKNMTLEELVKNYIIGKVVIVYKEQNEYTERDLATKNGTWKKYFYDNENALEVLYALDELTLESINTVIIDYYRLGEGYVHGVETRKENFEDNSIVSNLNMWNNIDN